MKSLKAKLITTIITIAGCLSVFAFAVTSFAWFYSYTKVTGNSVQLKTIVSENITFEETNFWVYGKNDAESSAFRTKDLTLRTYNLLELSSSSDLTEDDNVYNKRFYRVYLDFVNHGIDYKFLSVKFVLKKDESGNYSPLIPRGTTKVSPQISNVIEFKVFDNYESKINSYNETEPNIGEIYESCVTELNEIESKTFVNSNSKVGFIEFKIPIQPGEKSSDLIIEADYDTELMKKFIGSYKTTEQEGYEYIIAHPDEVGNFEKDIEAIYFDLVNE